MEIQNDFEVIIVGGGINGVSTAYALAKRNKKVLLLEQYDVNHAHGSSHGDGRIIRYAYPETIYTELAKLVYPLWQEIETRANTKITHKTGGIIFGKPNNEDVISVVQNLTKCNIPFEQFSREEAKLKFPMFNFPEDNIVIYQSDSGVAFASKAVKTIWNCAVALGATMLTNEKVTSLQVVNPQQVVVTTQNGKTFTAGKLVVAAGAWVKDLMKQLNLEMKLKVTEEEVFYFKDKRENSQEHSMYNMPVFIGLDEPQTYGLPQIDIPGVKVAWHHSGTEIDINGRKHLEKQKNRAEVVSGIVKNIFPNLETEAHHNLLCIYTSTVNHNFIVDCHPEYKNVVVLSACSGHGFKFGPAMGDIAALLSLDLPIPLNIDEFKL